MLQIHRDPIAQKVFIIFYQISEFPQLNILFPHNHMLNYYHLMLNIKLEFLKYSICIQGFLKVLKIFRILLIL